MTTVDVIIPVYNEADCLPELVRRLTNLMDVHTAFDWRVLLVENGSTDGSAQLISHVCNNDSRFIPINLIRNFGTEGGILAGLDVATGDVAVTMQADLEDPPELIPDMLTAWSVGSLYVYGEVRKRTHLPRWRRLATRLYYRGASWATDGTIRPNASDFRLMDRTLYELVRSIPDQNLFLRGLISWADFPTASIPLTRDPRFAGETKFQPIRAANFAFRGILSQSNKPLRLITLLGFILSAASLVGLTGFALRALTTPVPFAGFGTIVGLQILFFGLTTLCIGFVAEYVSLIYSEVRPRPHFVVATKRKRSP